MQIGEPKFLPAPIVDSGFFGDWNTSSEWIRQGNGFANPGCR
jgi:hypothetical protein